MTGWVVSQGDDGTWMLGTADWFLAGFESRTEALIWLKAYLLQVAAQQRQEQLERDRILAAMEPHGSPS